MGLGIRLSTPELRSSDVIDGVWPFWLLTFRFTNDDAGVIRDWLLRKRVENVKRVLFESSLGVSLKKRNFSFSKFYFVLKDFTFG